MKNERKKVGSLVHIFIFDSGPIPEDDEKYTANVVMSLLPDAMENPKLPIKIFDDQKMPKDIGQKDNSLLEKAMNYKYAWDIISATRIELVEGMSSEKQKFTFQCKEYQTGLGNRGILFAFYKLV